MTQPPSRRWRLFIPTRDSAHYIGVFLKHYRNMGIEPLYVVDLRSADHTYDVLRRCRADVHALWPSRPFGVTELVQAACGLCRNDWIVRLDDDEFPSKNMIAYIDKFTADPNNLNAVGAFNREWIAEVDGAFCFFRIPRYSNGDRYDAQRRLIYNVNLKFDHQIHTVGVTTDDLAVSYAPPENFLVHFDAILKSPTEKLEKIRRYEAIADGSGWFLADSYLTNIYDADYYQYHDDHLSQFSKLISELPKVDQSCELSLTNEEFAKAKLITHQVALKYRPPS